MASDAIKKAAWEWIHCELIGLRSGARDSAAMFDRQLEGGRLGPRATKEVTFSRDMMQEAHRILKSDVNWAAEMERHWREKCT